MLAIATVGKYDTTLEHLSNIRITLKQFGNTETFGQFTTLEILSNTRKECSTDNTRTYL